MLKIISTAATVLLLAINLGWAAPETGLSPTAACAAILTKLATLKPGERLPLEFMKKYFSVEPALSNAFVLPATKVSWAATRASAKADMQRLTKEIPNLADPTLYSRIAELKQPLPNFSFVADAEALDAKGVAYVTAEDGRLFRIDIRESIVRGKNKSISHSVSVNVWEVGPNVAPKQVAYADGPHMADGHGRWFHGHDKTTDAVVAQIATPGFERSSVPAILDWAKEFVNDVPK